MFICFFDYQRVVHREFVTHGQTLNQFYYGKNFERLRKRVAHMQSSIANNWMLLPDNAPCHMAISVMKLLAKKNIPLVQQPTYSPDVRQCTFLLFPKLNFTLKGVILGRWKISKSCNRPTKSEYD